MSNRRGRCFRAPRRCARRKARQDAAMVMLREAAPDAPIFQKFGGRARAGFMNEKSRFKLMSVFAGLRPIRRSTRRGQ